MNNVTKSILEQLDAVVFPEICIGCSKPGDLVCHSCHNAMPYIDAQWACTQCGAAWGKLTCTECKHTLVNPDVLQIVCCCNYEGIVPLIVKQYKDGGEKRLAHYIASSVVCALDMWSCLYYDTHWPFDAVCYIPASEKAMIKRGFDHMYVVAQIVSYLVGLPLLSALQHARSLDQRALTRLQRQQNVKDSFVVRAQVDDMSLLLLDDVVTTTATLQSGSDALVKGGAKTITAAAFARVWQSSVVGC